MKKTNKQIDNVILILNENAKIIFDETKKLKKTDKKVFLYIYKLLNDVKRIFSKIQIIMNDEHKKEMSKLQKQCYDDYSIEFDGETLTREQIEEAKKLIKSVLKTKKENNE